MNYLFQIRSEITGEIQLLRQILIWGSEETLKAQENILCDESKITSILHEVTGTANMLLISHILTKAIVF
jgi:hypothetical protein